MGSYNNYKMFGCFNRKFKISETEPPPDVKNVFSRYTENGPHMNADQMTRFLVQFQGEEGCTAADAAQLIQHIHNRRRHLSKHIHHSSPARSLDIDDFFDFLFQDDLNGPLKPQVWHDMSAPLQHYFIYTGHNSYLTGNQLSSQCSEIPIIRALERGVRGIELDLWPNSTRDNIHVLHGRTLTTPVTLIKCLKSIKKHAFVKSPYPVIITLEDHLTPELQATAAEMLTQVFGDMLYFPEPGCLGELPSPKELKHRVVLSTKPPKEYLESRHLSNERENVSPIWKYSSENDYSMKEESGSESNGVCSDPDEDYCEAATCQSDPSRKEISGNTDEQQVSDVMKSDLDGKGSTATVRSGAPEYKHLIAIRAGKAKEGLKHALTTLQEKVKRLSVNEQELEKATGLYGTDVVSFTQKNILRVYPKGMRVTSSNFNPMLGWIHGAQMVAFNMQGYGKSLWLMHGMFRSNGGCGYVKKPQFLLERHPNGEVFDPKVTLPVKLTLKVNVYLGDGWRLDFSHTHFDSYSPPDFYTKVYIIGVGADSGKRKTRIIEDEWVPKWGEEFEFPLTVPELALLRIEVREYDMSEKDDFGGQTCLPVSELRPGIRSVSLHDKKGEKLKSVRLLMRFQFMLS
ncbi:unnamed protein product [Cuscuta epithymum]|uniref:Phosphoinositide phospholipase C n=1 Tax=Cuscuta epithymum TaxID=186058 RepID=A0AAV0GJF3_9ASTE|nr:unnamed protein product [Cuscuta epithymum]